MKETKKNTDLEQIMTELKVLDHIYNFLPKYKDNGNGDFYKFKENIDKAHFFVIGKFIATLTDQFDELESSMK